MNKNLNERLQTNYVVKNATSNAFKKANGTVIF